MAGTLVLWDRPRSTEQIRRTLRIVRREGFRAVHDAAGNIVRVRLNRIITHIAARPDDRARWQFIPAIVPTIKKASSVFRRRDRYGRDTYTYEARMLSRFEKDPEHTARQRTFFVFSLVEPGQEKRVREFSSVLHISSPGKVRAQERKAGVRLDPRQNPSAAAYVRTRDTGDRRLTPKRLPGAGSARTHESSITPAILAIVLIVGIGQAIARLQCRNDENPD